MGSGKGSRVTRPTVYRKRGFCVLLGAGKYFLAPGAARLSRRLIEEEIPL